MPDALMIFAAGRGTRMAPLTDRLPKALIRVGGQTLIDRAIDMGRAAGFGRIVVNVHHHADQMEAHLAGRVLVSDERGALLETGGGLKKALGLLGPGPVATLNPDVVWTGANPLIALREAWRPGRMDALLALVAPERAEGRIGAGDFGMDGEGRLSRGGPWVYGGAQILHPAGLAGIAEEAFSLNRLWDARMGRVCGLVHPGGWCDVGRPECIPLAEALLA